MNICLLQFNCLQYCSSVFIFACCVCGLQRQAVANFGASVLWAKIDRKILWSLAIQTWSAGAPGIFKTDILEYFAPKCCLWIVIRKVWFFEVLLSHMHFCSTRPNNPVCIPSVQILRTQFKVYRGLSAVFHAFKSHTKSYHRTYTVPHPVFDCFMSAYWQGMLLHPTEFFVICIGSKQQM